MTDRRIRSTTTTSAGSAGSLAARARARLVGLAATLVVLAILAGLPIVLLALGADPVPTSGPSLDAVRDALTAPDDGTLALAAIKVIAWVAWAFLAGSILLEIAARLRGIHPPRLPGLALPQTAARGLVGAAMLLIVAAPVAAPAARAAAGPGPAAAPAVTATVDTAPPETPATTAAASVRGAATHTAHAPDRQAPSTRTPSQRPPGRHADDVGDRVRHTVRHTVRPGESLWSIAADQFGDGTRYPEIAHLNVDILHGNPGFLLPGTVLRIPAEQPGTAAPGGDRPAHGYKVHRGDTLSQIAQDQLGDPDRYPEIAEASRHTTQPGGEHLRDPDVIDVGWTLTIPATRAATVGHPDDQATPQEPHQPPHAAAPPAAAPPAAAPVGNGAPGASATNTARARGLERHAPGAQAPPPAAHEESDGQPPWLLAGLSGGGALLAGSMLLVLRRRRRSQFRARRPGRTIATPPPLLAPVEKTLTAVGDGTAPTVEWMDDCLRRMAATQTARQAPIPELAAVELTGRDLRLHLSAPAELDQPWTPLTADRLHWSLPVGSDLAAVGQQVEDQPAPYPLLVTIGVADDPTAYPSGGAATGGAVSGSGALWLLNCEDLNLAVTGDETFGRDFARHLVAELACNLWSRGVRVDCVGIAEEVAQLNTDRIRAHPRRTDQTDPAGNRSDPAAAALADAVTIIDRAAELGVDVATARAAQAGADPWPARLLLVDAAATYRTPALDQLLALIDQHSGTTGTSVVVHGPSPTATTATNDSRNTDARNTDTLNTGTQHTGTQHTGTTTAGGGFEVRITADGRVLLPHAGLDLVAVGLTSDEAQGCAALLAASEDLNDVPIPVHDTPDSPETPDTPEAAHPESAADPSADGWRALTDAAGALRGEHTLPRATPWQDRPGPTSSLLEHDDQDYLEAAATTAEDLDALAPQVPETVRAEVERADPDLDEDLAAWFDPDCPLPRLTLLGPVQARTRGVPVTKRKPFFTEVLAYLVNRPHGATPEELADAFGISPGKARVYAGTVRDWLGTNPRTGDKHLPDARQTPAAQTRGVAVYQVVDLLCDADLFRRLRVRGQSRGPDGMQDLQTALQLVQGRPFDQLRTGGWSWLLEGNRLDQHLTCAIVDVSHLVTTHALQAGDLQLARLVAENATLAAPDEEIPRLDLAAVATAAGHHAEADHILRDQIANRTDDDGPPPELPERSQRVITDHGWLPHNKEAS